MGTLGKLDMSQVLRELGVLFAVQALWDRKGKGLTEVLAEAGCFEVVLDTAFEETAAEAVCETGSPGSLALSSLMSSPFVL